MAGTKGSTLMTEVDFNIIKKLRAMNLSTQEIKKLTGRSDSVVYYVDNSDTFEDYKEHNRLRNAKFNTKKEAKVVKQSELIQEPKNNDERLQTNIEQLVNSIDKLCEIMTPVAKHYESLAPLNKEAKESFLFGRRK